MKISPKAFFHIINEGAFSRNLHLAINGCWSGFLIESSEVYPEPWSGDISVFLHGRLIPEGKITPVTGETVARIGSHTIPCEISACSINYENLGYESIAGDTAYQSSLQNISVSIVFRYDEYQYNNCGITDTIKDAPPELTRMIKVLDNPRKKTVFDIIDLD